jgi:hypothetical protein
VLDDVDRAGEDVWAAVGEPVAGIRARPVLVVATAEDPGLRAGLRADAAIVLAPLDADGVRAVVRLYAGARDDADVPIERLAAASGGVPQRLHRAAGESARTLVVGRLGDVASRIAAERPVLRAAEDDMVGNIVDLQAARKRAESWAVAAEGVVACPFKGLASFDVDDAGIFLGRERLVAEVVAGLTGAPLMGSWGRRERQVVGAACRAARRARRRRAAGERALGARAAAPARSRCSGSPTGCCWPATPSTRRTSRPVSPPLRAFPTRSPTGARSRPAPRSASWPPPTRPASGSAIRPTSPGTSRASSRRPRPSARTERSQPLPTNSLLGPVCRDGGAMDFRVRPDLYL